MRSTWKVGKIFGIPFEIHWTWSILFFWTVLMIFYSGFLFFPSLQMNRAERIITAVAAAFLFYGSSLLHEIGHCLMAVRHGIPIQKILLFGMGILGFPTKSAKTWGIEFKMAAIGPLVSLLFFALFFLVFNLFSLPNPIFFLIFILSFLILINTIFNLLPIFPLDGGRILRALFWKITKDVLKATKIVMTISSMVSFLPFAVGIYIIYYQPSWGFWGIDMVTSNSAGIFGGLFILMSFLLHVSSQKQCKKEIAKLRKEVEGNV